MYLHTCRHIAMNFWPAVNRVYVRANAYVYIHVCVWVLVWWCDGMCVCEICAHMYVGMLWVPLPQHGASEQECWCCQRGSMYQCPHWLCPNVYSGSRALLWQDRPGSIAAYACASEGVHVCVHERIRVRPQLKNADKLQTRVTTGCCWCCNTLQRDAPQNGRCSCMPMIHLGSTLQHSATQTGRYCCRPNIYMNSHSTICHLISRAWKLWMIAIYRRAFGVHPRSQYRALFTHAPWGVCHPRSERHQGIWHRCINHKEVGGQPNTQRKNSFWS